MHHLQRLSEMLKAECPVEPWSASASAHVRPRLQRPLHAVRRFTGLQMLQRMPIRMLGSNTDRHVKDLENWIQSWQTECGDS